MQPATTYRQSMRTGFYVAVIASLFILFLGWWFGSMTSILSANDRVMAIGRLFGLLAGWSVVVEIILMSRVPFIERAFDLQEISDLHRLNGYTLLVSISGHFAYQLIGYAETAHISWWSQFLAFSSSQYEDVLWATLGTIIFFGVGAISIHMIRTKMRYEIWYLVHLTIYFGIYLTFLHQIKLGGDFIANFWFASYWYMLYILAFVVWAWYRVVRQFVLFVRHRFKVLSIEKTATNTYSVVLTGKNLREFDYEAGQYATWRFMTPSLWYEAHPFSFSSSPGMEVLRFTIKASLDYRERLMKLKVGSYVIVDGPRGNFTADRAAETSNTVLIAGGIGITPFLSNIRQLLHDGKNVLLLYAVRTPEDVAFSDELRQLQAYGLKINFFVDSVGQRITYDALSRVAYEDTTIYICGPDGMSKALVKNLKQLGVSSENIVTERFAY